jgi:hypothetical protein
MEELGFKYIDGEVLHLSVKEFDVNRFLQRLKVSPE